MRIDHVVNHDKKSDVDKFIAWIKEQGGMQIWCQQDKTDQRSVSLNAYYWGVVLQYIAEETGIDSYYWHCWFRGKFIPHIIFVDDADLASTTNCTNEDMWAYCEMIRTWAHLNIRPTSDRVARRRVFTIPDPWSVIRVNLPITQNTRINDPGVYDEEEDD